MSLQLYIYANLLGSWLLTVEQILRLKPKVCIILYCGGAWVCRLNEYRISWNLIPNTLSPGATVNAIINSRQSSLCLKYHHHHQHQHHYHKLVSVTSLMLVPMKPKRFFTILSWFGSFCCSLSRCHVYKAVSRYSFQRFQSKFYLHFCWQSCISATVHVSRNWEH